MNRREATGGILGAIAAVFVLGRKAEAAPEPMELAQGLKLAINGVGVLRHPVNPECREAAEQFAQGLQPGSVLVLPNTRDCHGEYEWDFRIEGGNQAQVRVSRRGVETVPPTREEFLAFWGNFWDSSIRQGNGVTLRVEVGSEPVAMNGEVVDWRTNGHMTVTAFSRPRES